MYIFDTDHLSFLQRNGTEGKNILRRLTALDNPEVAVTVITYEEQLRGWLSVIARAKALDDQINAYKGLQTLAYGFCNVNILPFNQDAANTYGYLRKQYPRLGSMDLKIAAIVLAHNGILLTRNFSDFRQIENLKLEDWSV